MYTYAEYRHTRSRVQYVTSGRRSGCTVYSINANILYKVWLLVVIWKPILVVLNLDNVFRKNDLSSILIQRRKQISFPRVEFA